MKTIITAIGNPTLNNKLKEFDNYKIISKDIQYQDGIFEILEEYKNIDIIILSELLPGNNSIKELIKNIKLLNKSIEFIIILQNNNEELINYLHFENINKIIFNNKSSFEEIIKLINSIKLNTNENLKKEIEQLKEIILNNNLVKRQKKLYILI